MCRMDEECKWVVEVQEWDRRDFSLMQEVKTQKEQNQELNTKVANI